MKEGYIAFSPCPLGLLGDIAKSINPLLQTRGT
jgi:hypothetical protein